MKFITMPEALCFELVDLINFQQCIYGQVRIIEANNEFNKYLLANNLFISEELLENVIKIKTAELSANSI